MECIASRDNDDPRWRDLLDHVRELNDQLVTLADFHLGNNVKAQLTDDKVMRQGTGSTVDACLEVADATCVVMATMRLIAAKHTWEWSFGDQQQKQHGFASHCITRFWFCVNEAQNRACVGNDGSCIVAFKVWERRQDSLRAWMRDVRDGAVGQRRRRCGQRGGCWQKWQHSNGWFRWWEKRFPNSHEFKWITVVKPQTEHVIETRHEKETEHFTKARCEKISFVNFLPLDSLRRTKEPVGRCFPFHASWFFGFSLFRGFPFFDLAEDFDLAVILVSPSDDRLRAVCFAVDFFVALGAAVLNLLCWPFSFFQFEEPTISSDLFSSWFFARCSANWFCSLLLFIHCVNGSGAVQCSSSSFNSHQTKRTSRLPVSPMPTPVILLTGWLLSINLLRVFCFVTLTLKFDKSDSPKIFSGCGWVDGNSFSSKSVFSKCSFCDRISRCNSMLVVESINITAFFVELGTLHHSMTFPWKVWARLRKSGSGWQTVMPFFSSVIRVSFDLSDRSVNWPLAVVTKSWHAKVRFPPNWAAWRSSEFPSFVFALVPFFQIFLGIRCWQWRAVWKSLIKQTFFVTVLKNKRFMKFFMCHFHSSSKGRHVVVGFPNNVFTGQQILGLAHTKSKQMQFNAPCLSAIHPAADRTSASRLWKRGRIQVMGQNCHPWQKITTVNDFLQFQWRECDGVAPCALVFEFFGFEFLCIILMRQWDKVSILDLSHTGWFQLKRRNDKELAICVGHMCDIVEITHTLLTIRWSCHPSDRHQIAFVPVFVSSEAPITDLDGSDGWVFCDKFRIMITIKNGTGCLDIAVRGCCLLQRTMRKVFDEIVSRVIDWSWRRRIDIFVNSRQGPTTALPFVFGGFSGGGIDFSRRTAPGATQFVLAFQGGFQEICSTVFVGCVLIKKPGLLQKQFIGGEFWVGLLQLNQTGQSLHPRSGSLGNMFKSGNATPTFHGRVSTWFGQTVQHYVPHVKESQQDRCFTSWQQQRHHSFFWFYSHLNTHLDHFHLHHSLLDFPCSVLCDWTDSWLTLSSSPCVLGGSRMGEIAKSRTLELALIWFHCLVVPAKSFSLQPRFWSLWWQPSSEFGPPLLPWIDASPTDLLGLVPLQMSCQNSKSCDHCNCGLNSIHCFKVDQNCDVASRTLK